MIPTVSPFPPGSPLACIAAVYRVFEISSSRMSRLVESTEALHDPDGAIGSPDLTEAQTERKAVSEDALSPMAAHANSRYRR